MSIATVVTMGYGSFGSVNLLPTIGYSQSAVVVPAVGVGFEARAADNRLHGKAVNNKLQAAARANLLHGKSMGNN